MNTNAHEQLESIFSAAAEINDAKARQEYLSKACDGDMGLRSRLEQLIDAHERASGFLRPKDGVPETILTIGMEAPGARIGNYKLLEQIGDGGMGIVFMADQLAPVKRRVALKIIKPGMDSKQVIVRFEAERQALAMMEHPNIAKILDAGATDAGRPYFVMELVKGMPITAYCDTARLPIRQRLELLISACHAVQHAHTKGIIHRDLKPSNMLVTLHDGVPVPRVIDFGIAKATHSLTENTLFTCYGQMLGTPLYMSPEQAALSALDIDTRSDVYSLGVLLYELLTGSTPFRSEAGKDIAFDEIRRVLREDDPPRPSLRISTLRNDTASTVAEFRQVDVRRLSTTIKGELDWIVMKALEKDRNRRYQSASALAEDLRRYLNGESVLASPPSSFYQLKKLSFRYRALIATATLVILALLVGLVGTAWQASRAARAEESVRKESDKLRVKEVETRKERDAARMNQYFSDIVSCEADWERGYLHRLHGKLMRHLPLPGEQERRGWEWHYLFALCHREHRTLHKQSSGNYATWSSDGAYIATGGHIWNARTGELNHCFITSVNPTSRGVWSHDAQRYAWIEDGLHVWNRQTNEIVELHGHEERIGAVCWRPDGKRLATGSTDGTMQIWDVENKTTLLNVDIPGRGVHDIAWSPDGQLLAVGITNIPGLVIWNAITGETVAMPDFVSKPALEVAWDMEGGHLAIATRERWFIVTRDKWHIEWQQSFDRVGGYDIAWCPDGKRLAVADGEFVSIWETHREQPLQVLGGHVLPVHNISWSPDGEQLVTSDSGDEMRVWQLSKAPPPIVLNTGVPLQSLAFAADSGTLVAVENDGRRRQIWDSNSGLRIDEDMFPVGGELLWSPDRRLVAEYRNAAVPLVSVYSENGTLLSRWRGEPEDHIHCVSWGPSSSLLAISRQSETHVALVDVWNVYSQTTVCRWAHRTLAPLDLPKGWHRRSYLLQLSAWSPDGTKLAVDARGEQGGRSWQGFRWQGHIYVIDVLTGGTLLKHNLGGLSDIGEIASLSWSFNGETIAAGSFTGLIEAVDLTSGVTNFSTRLNSTAVCCISISPDGTRIVAGSEDGVVHVMSAAGGDDLLTFDLRAAVKQVAWSPDGKKLAAATAAGDIFIWDASSSYELSERGLERGELAWAYWKTEPVKTSDGELARLRAVATLAPDRREYWDLRGHAFAKLGDFESAAVEFGKESDVARHNLRAALNQAYATLGTGNLSQFERLCVELLRVYGDTTTPATRNFLATLFACAPIDFGEKELGLRLARSTLGGGKAGIDEAATLRLGACLYRNGQFQECARMLTELVTYLNKSPDSTDAPYLAQCLYFLAMGEYQLRRPTLAQQYLLESANVAAQSKDADWIARVRLNALDVEARRLIGR